MIQNIEITVAQHRDTDLLIAYSDDLMGLYVSARDELSLVDALPGAIKDLLEADGVTSVSEVTIVDVSNGDWISPQLLAAKAHLEQKAA